MFISLKVISWVKPGSIADVLRCWNMDGNVSKKGERWKIVHHAFGGQFGLRGTRGALGGLKTTFRILK